MLSIWLRGSYVGRQACGCQLDCSPLVDMWASKLATGGHEFSIKGTAIPRQQPASKRCGGSTSPKKDLTRSEWQAGLLWVRPVAARSVHVSAEMDS